MVVITLVCYHTIILHWNMNVGVHINVNLHVLSALKAKKKRNLCSDKSGHSGDHNCNKKNHTCGRQCSLAKYLNCNKSCCLLGMHDGPCKCNSNLHLCGQPCSSPACKNNCQLNIEKTHTVHKCVDNQCTFGCYFKNDKEINCVNPCSCKDHFHGNEELSKRFAEENGIEWKQEFFPTNHFCEKDHPCNQYCKSPGICQVKVEMVKDKVQEKTFVGKRSTFTYQAAREANGEREKCCIRIPQGQMEHKGNHVHTTDSSKIHSCDVKCPSCGYFCELEYSHAGNHKTSHGNMRHTFFVSNQEQINIGDRKYVVGECGEAEMCNMFCKSQGQGHLHIVTCDSKEGQQCTHSKNDGRRHETIKYEPEPDIPKDELTHENFWNSIKFEDPCSTEEIELFKKCSYQCARDHDENKDKPEKEQKKVLLPITTLA